MDSPQTSDSSATESPAQKQARLRRERRNAKLQTGGSARLNAITNLSGRPAPVDDIPPSSQPKPAPRPQAGDPEEVDISDHYYTPRTTNRPPPPSSSLDAFDPTATNPFAGFPGMGPDGASNPTDDPMLQMLQQMLGSGQPGAGGHGASGLPPGLPPGLAQMLGMPGDGAQSPQQQQAAPSSANIWRIVHALFSLFLALYVALGATFTGSKVARTRGQGVAMENDEGLNRRFFWLFATAETLLQSSRYFWERGGLPASGLMGTLGQMLPEPYAGYVRVVGRYSVIYTTVVADAMVVVFVLGCLAWWQGTVVS